jgi:AbrB family looped-hinge helix DNA binding protein
MLTSALTSKGQVTIPSDIRRQLHLRPGDKVGFMVENDHIVMVRKEKNIKAAFGILKAKRTVSLAKINKVAREKVKRDYSRH